jgi:phenylpyruvate tautomerase PptA (4-oxalocrotonate tautomerase family)
MPLLTLTTSADAPTEARSAALLRDLSVAVARELNKPETYVMTCLVPRATMTFAGSFEPACAVEIKSIGGLGGDAASRLTAAVSKLVHEALGVPSSRVYVVCTDVPASLWGLDGAMFG